MRIPIMNVKKPVFLFPISIEPVGSKRRDFLCTFQAPFSGVLYIMKPGQPMEGRMSVGEGAYGSRPMPTSGKAFGERCPGKFTAETAPRSFGTRICGGTTMPHDTGAGSETPHSQSAATRQARNIGCITILHAKPFGRQTINIGRRVAMIAIASEVVCSKCVYVDI